MKNMGILYDGVVFNGFGNGKELVVKMGGENELRKGFVMFLGNL